MPGRMPKPDALRARTNSESASLILVPDPKAKVPELAPTRDWQDLTRDYWATLWTSGMAQMWNAADTPGLFRLATTFDDYLRAESPEERRALSSEIRQLEKQFGLSPEARTKLRWLVAEADMAGERATANDPPGRPVSADRSILFED